MVRVKSAWEFFSKMYNLHLLIVFKKSENHACNKLAKMFSINSQFWPLYLSVFQLTRSICDFWDFFTYSRYKSFVGHVVCKYFWPIYSLSFHSLYKVLCRAKFFLPLMKSNLCFSFHELYLCAKSMNSFLRFWRFSTYL